MGRHVLAPTPPMGWNSWNTFYDAPDEELVFSTADAMVKEGLLQAGYRYLVIDDGWQAKTRDAAGDLQPDPAKFPHGMKAVADYVHGKGLLFGLYSCCGLRTCGGFPGSFSHEYSDALQFATWGVDYLKFDNCNRPNLISSEALMRRMAMALRSSGRNICLAACQWGTEEVWRWAGSSGVQTYRSTVDIQDTWRSIESIARARLSALQYGGFDCFNDMDMLVVGMHGGGKNPEASLGGCSDEEYQTHFALWAMLNSPLMVGCDIRAMTPKTREILLNQDVIAINQDPGCRNCYLLTNQANPDVFILVKPLSDYDYAVGLFNFSDVPFNVFVNFWDMGVTQCQVRLFDLYSHQDEGLASECFSRLVPSHGSRLYRCRPEVKR